MFDWLVKEKLEFSIENFWTVEITIGNINKIYKKIFEIEVFL
jgi:hypothetical protein